MKTALALVTTRMMCGQIEHLAYEILDGDEQRSRLTHDQRWASCAVSRETNRADNWILWGDLPSDATEI